MRARIYLWKIISDRKVLFLNGDQIVCQLCCSSSCCSSFHWRWWWRRWKASNVMCISEPHPCCGSNFELPRLSLNWRSRKHSSNQNDFSLRLSADFRFRFDLINRLIGWIKSMHIKYLLARISSRLLEWIISTHAQNAHQTIRILFSIKSGCHQDDLIFPPFKWMLYSHFFLHPHFHFPTKGLRMRQRRWLTWIGEILPSWWAP